MSASRPITDRYHLTTGQIARLCEVAPRTVSKWIDSGKLKGYRIPGSLDRRVSPLELKNFLVANEMGVPYELGYSLATRGIEPPREGEAESMARYIHGHWPAERIDQLRHLLEFPADLAGGGAA